jgi:hypothetical protein
MVSPGAEEQGNSSGAKENKIDVFQNGIYSVVGLNSWAGEQIQSNETTIDIIF